MRACPHCHGTGRAMDADAVAELRQWAESRGHVILPGDRVQEHVAAAMLGREPGTLRNWSYGARPMPFTVVRGRRTYRLADIGTMFREAD